MAANVGTPEQVSGFSGTGKDEPVGSEWLPLSGENGCGGGNRTPNLSGRRDHETRVSTAFSRCLRFSEVPSVAKVWQTGGRAVKSRPSFEARIPRSVHLSIPSRAKTVDHFMRPEPAAWGKRHLYFTRSPGRCFLSTELARSRHTETDLFAEGPPGVFRAASAAQCSAAAPALPCIRVTSASRPRIRCDIC